MREGISMEDKFYEERLRHEHSEATFFMELHRTQEMIKSLVGQLNQIYTRLDILEGNGPKEVPILYVAKDYYIQEDGILHNPKEIPLPNIIFDMAQEIKKLEMYRSWAQDIISEIQNIADDKYPDTPYWCDTGSNYDVAMAQLDQFRRDIRRQKRWNKYG